MKKIMIALVSAIDLSLPQMAQAQGTLYVSNLEQTPISSGVVGSDSWLAQGFLTGNNTSGYTLNSVQLLMGAAMGNPNGFTVSLYNASYSSQFATPGNSIDTLSGSDPSTGGLFTYTDSTSLLLSSSTFYFIVVTASTSIATDAYEWNAAQNSQGQSIWFLDNIHFSSTNGADWGYSRSYLLQLGIYATPVPEPSTYALMGLGLACLSFWRHRRRSSTSNTTA
jgi:hypothetical protein